MKLLEQIFHRGTRVQTVAVENIQLERQNILSPNSNFYVTEAYKMLRTNVLFSLAGKQTCSVIAITSPFQHEGKSITSLNLAISMAESNKKVLLVDCDLRKPKAARLLNVSSPVGLSNVLLDLSLLSRAIINIPQHNIDVLLSGSVPPNPSELLISQNMTTILDMLKEEYDCIILDTPPVNVVADAIGLTSNVDGYLLVVRAGESDRPAVSHALQQLTYAKARIFGYILNGVRMQKTTFGKYSRYRKLGGRYSKYGKYGTYGGYGYCYGSSYAYSDTSPSNKQ